MYCIVADISFEETEEARDSQPSCLLVTACPLAADCPKIRVRDGIMLQPGVMSRGTRGLYSGQPVCGSPPLCFFLPACSLALHSFFYTMPTAVSALCSSLPDDECLYRKLKAHLLLPSVLANLYTTHLHTIQCLFRV